MEAGNQPPPLPSVPPHGPPAYRPPRGTGQRTPLATALIVAAEAAPLITELIENEGYDLEELYDDPDIGPALATDAMTPVRDKHPRPKDEVEAKQ